MGVRTAVWEVQLIEETLLKLFESYTYSVPSSSALIESSQHHF